MDQTNRSGPASFGTAAIFPIRPSLTVGTCNCITTVTIVIITTGVCKVNTRPRREGRITTLSSPPRPESSMLKRKRGNGSTKSGVCFARRFTPVTHPRSEPPAARGVGRRQGRSENKQHMIIITTVIIITLFVLLLLVVVLSLLLFYTSGGISENRCTLSEMSRKLHAYLTKGIHASKNLRDIQEIMYLHNTCVYIYIYTHTYTHTRMYLSLYIYIYTHIHIHIHISLSLYIYIYTHTYTYMHTYIHTYIHTNIPTNKQTYIHSFIHTCMHTYIHTYIHTPKYICIICIYVYIRLVCGPLASARMGRSLEDLRGEDLGNVTI